MILKTESGNDVYNKRPSGSASVEIRNGKGSLTVFVQKMEKPVCGVYSFYFIAARDRTARGLNVGDLIIDNSGKGSLKISFDPDNVGNTGIAIEQFQVFAVLYYEGGKRDSFRVPLVGYAGERVSWRSVFCEFGRSQTENGEAYGQIGPVHGETREKQEEVDKQTQQAVVPEKLLDYNKFAKEDRAKIENISLFTECKTDSKQETNILDPESIQTEEEKRDFSTESQFSENNNQQLGHKSEGMEETEMAVNENADLYKNRPNKVADFVAAEDNSPEPMEKEPIKAEEKKEEAKENKYTEYVTKEDFYGDFHISSEKPHDTFREITRKFNQELKLLEQTGVLTPEEIQQITSKTKKFDNSNEIETLFTNNEKMLPFGKNDTREFIRICADELALVPGVPIGLLHHPLLILGSKKYNHLILGKGKDAAGCIYIGVPDQYYQDYVNTARSIGFDTFRCCNPEAKLQNGQHGYWMMALQQ